MRGTPLTLALVLLAAALGALVPSARGQAVARAQAVSVARGASTGGPLGGVNIAGLEYGSTPAQAEVAVAQAHELGAKLVRTTVPWSVMEPTATGKPDSQALAFTDRLVDKAAADGIRVIMLVDSTPCWDSSAPRSLLRGCTSTTSSRANAWPPRSVSAYASIVELLARRYGSDLAAIEVWNEPDLINEAYFAGPDKARHYADLLRAAYPAVKRGNPHVRVLAGALVSSNGVFLKALYADGIKGYYNGLAVHFYTLTLAALRSIHEVQLANGDHEPLWLDEFGWSSCYPNLKLQQEQECVTPAIQAQNLRDMFRSLSHTPWIAGVVSYDVQDYANRQFGVLNLQGKPKPSFAALREVLTSPSGNPQPVTLKLRVQGDHVVASGSGPVGDYMELDVYVGSVHRYRSLFTLNRFNRYSRTLPAALGTRGLRVSVFQYWQGAASATTESV